MSLVFSGKTIGVMLGGLSHERAVSLDTGRAIATALRDRGHTVVEIDAGRDLYAQIRLLEVDVIYNALHGTYGEDGRVQGLLDWMGVPYTGEGLEASHACFDKALSKTLLRAADLPVAADLVVSAARLQALRPSDLPFDLPVVVKPAAEGSSVGVSVVRNITDWDPAIAAAAGKGAVLVERFVAGPELSVAILGETVLGSVEVEATRGFYDYVAKYTADGGTAYHLPPRLDPAVVTEVERLALAAHTALGCRGATRTDLIVGEAGPLLLEVNTLPGMTATSLVPKIAAAQGLSFGALLERILDLATCGPDREDAHGA